MSNLAVVDTQLIIPKEYNGQRVVTFKEIDKVHERKDGTARNNFSQNRDKFILGSDYYKVPKNELSCYLPPNSKIGNPKLDVILLTKAGYLMLVKSLTDKKSWEIQRALVNNYFDKQEKVTAPQIQERQLLSTELSPQMQMFKAIFENEIAQDAKINAMQNQVEQLQNKINATNFILPETTAPIDALFLAPVTLYTTTDIAKAFNLSARAVNRYLLSQDIHSPYKKGWKLHSKYDDCNYVHQRVGSFKTPKGEKENILMTWWTATGKDFVCAILKNAGLKQKGQIKPYDRHKNRGKRKAQ